MASEPNPVGDLPEKKPRGRFTKGIAANPRGRTPGSRNKASLIAEALMRDDLPAVVRSVIDAAIGGDMVAARLICERLVPTRRGRPVSLDGLPPLKSMSALVEAGARIASAAASGELTTDEAAGLVSVVEFQRRAIESVEFERRLAALEGRMHENVDQ